MKIRTTKVFEKNFNIENKKIVINRWGTRSGKTYNILLLFALWLMTGKIDNSWKIFTSWILHIVRKYSVSLRVSVQRDFEEILHNLWLWNLLKINKTDKTYCFWNRIVEFIWADDEQKLRWVKRDILYCNEANELSYKKEFFQLLIRTKYRVFIDFNPDDVDHWINKELELKRKNIEKDVEVIVSTYKDNPFLSEAEVREIEILRKTDPLYWKIYWEWEYGKLQGLIFENINIIEKIPEEAEFICYWMDFWFTNDPTVIVWIYKYNSELIFDEILYQTQMTNQDLVNFLKSQNIWKNSENIRADSSEPKSIEEIYRAWFNIKPVEKWPDSIMFWINKMKEFKINVTSSSINTIKEFRKYTWLTDKEWKSLNKPIDWFNHSLDAIRYWIMMSFWRQKNIDIFIW